MPSKPLSSQRTVSDVCFDLLSRYELCWLALLLLLYVVAAVISARHKPFWYDEIFSIIVATQPNWHAFSQAMPADGNPPLYALLTRLSIAIFGISELSVRLPSLVAFFMALVGVYWFVRRAVGPVLALLAVLLTLSETGWTYSFEARPYALLLAFMMLGLVSWQSAVDAQQALPPRPRRLALLGIMVAIVGGILSHSIGVVEVGFPLVVGEASRLWRSRRPDWPVLATALAALPALAVTIPMMRRTNALVLKYAANDVLASPRASWHIVIYTHLLEVLFLLAVLTWATRRPRKNTAEDAQPQGLAPLPSVPSHLLGAALGAAALIPFVYFLLRLSTGYFLCRYGIGSIIGVSIVFVFLLARSPRQHRTLCVFMISLLALSFGRGLADQVLHPPEFVAVRAIDAETPPGVPVVFANPIEYMRSWWYASGPQKSQFLYLTDTKASIQYGYVVVEVAMVAEKPLISAQFEDYENFVAAHNHFRLSITDVSPTLVSPTVVLKNRLEASGFRTTLIDRQEGVSLYDVQR